MHLARVLDDKAPNYLKQGLGWSYHAPSAGHDAIQLALGMTFRPGRDYLFPYYRDLTTCVAAGLSAEEILLNGMSKATDVASGGRHMSNHFAKPSIGIQNVSSGVSNHAQHAAGLGRAIKTYRKDAIVFCSLGESSTSEGYFYEAVNGASREKLPGRLRRPGQRLRDLGAQERPDGEPLRLRQLLGVPEPEDHPLRRAGRLRLVPRAARGGRVRPQRRRLRHGPRPLRADPLPLQLRPARALPHAGGARGGARGRPAAAFPQAPARDGPRRRGGARRDRAAKRPGVRRGRRTARKAAPEPDPATIHDFVPPEPWVLGEVARGTSRRLRRRDDVRPGLERDAQGRVPPQPGHVHLGAGRRLPGQGRRLQRHQGHAEGVRRGARLQRSDRRGLHHGHGRRLLAGSPTTSASSSRAPSSPTTSGPRPSRWSRCRTSTGARTASSCPT